MKLYTETEQKQWLLSKPESFTLVKEDKQSLAFLIEYIKKKYQREAIVLKVRGQKSISLASLMDEWAAALQFPLYFGENLNAFIDCMRDLPHSHNACLVVVVANANQLLIEEPEAAKNFWETIKYIVQLPYSDLPKPFQLIFQVETEEDQNLFQSKMQDWGITCDHLKGDWADLFLDLIDNS